MSSERREAATVTLQQGEVAQKLGTGKGEMNWEIRIDIYTLLYVK